jgi:hypothetical protein
MIIAHKKRIELKDFTRFLEDGFDNVDDFHCVDLLVDIDIGSDLTKPAFSEFGLPVSPGWKSDVHGSAPSKRLSIDLRQR